MSETVKNRITGSQIAVVDNRSKTFIDDDTKWYSVCDTHSNLCGHETRKLAEYHAVVPSWCEDCSAIMYENGYYEYTSDEIG